MPVMMRVTEGRPGDIPMKYGAWCAENAASPADTHDTYGREHCRPCKPITSNENDANKNGADASNLPHHGGMLAEGSIQINWTPNGHCKMYKHIIPIWGQA